MKSATPLALAVSLFVAPAAAQRAPADQIPNGPRTVYGSPHFNYMDQCYDDTRKVEDRVAFCRGMIGAGRGPDFDAAMQVTIGEIYAGAGRYDEAIAQFGEAIRLRPDNASAYNSRCWTRALRGTELDTALADCDRAIQLAPENPDFVDSRGMVAFRQGRFGAALKDYDAALALYAKRTEPKPNPRSTPALFMRGITRRRLGNAAEGDKDIAAALAFDPLVQLKYADYGITPSGDVVPASQIMTPALVGEARHPLRVCLDKKRTAEVRLAFCNLAMKKDGASQNAGVEVAIAATYADTGQPDRAIEAFGRALALDPNNEDALVGQCKIYAFMAKNLDAAIRDCNQAVKYDPENADAWDGLAVIEYRMGHMDAALNDCNAAMGRAFRRRPGTLFMRGVVEHRLGNTQVGDDSIRTAVSLDPAIGEMFAVYGIGP